jgi:hypothetical protein
VTFLVLFKQFEPRPIESIFSQKLGIITDVEPVKAPLVSQNKVVFSPEKPTLGKAVHVLPVVRPEQS